MAYCYLLMNVFFRSVDSRCEFSWDVYCGHENALIENKDDHCVPLQCAKLSSTSFFSLNTNAESIVPDSPTSPGQEVVVTCREGYRATSSSQASCADPLFFVATCGSACGYESKNVACKRVTCSLALTDNIILDPTRFP